jgi:hypothetical protein
VAGCVWKKGGDREDFQRDISTVVSGEESRISREGMKVDRSDGELEDQELPKSIRTDKREGQEGSSAKTRISFRSSLRIGTVRAGFISNSI